MPFTSHRLDHHLVPPQADDPAVGPARALFDELVARRVIATDGRPGPAASSWMTGGFARIRVDDPGRVTLYANQTGGFRVSCPDCGANLVPTFLRALAAWRGGAARVANCPDCGRTWPLEDLAFLPAVGFGRGSLVTADASSAELATDGAAWAAAALPGWRVVLRRP